MSDSNHNFSLFHNYIECKLLYEVIEGSWLTEEMMILTDVKKTLYPSFWQNKAGKKARLGKKINQEVSGEQNRTLEETFLYSIL